MGPGGSAPTAPKRACGVVPLLVVYVGDYPIAVGAAEAECSVVILPAEGLIAA
jgi:hypothetical protein